MKPSISILITCLLLFIIACEKNSEYSNFELMGTWLEQADRTDTLDFTKFGSDLAINLRRGSEFHNGYLLPKYGAGYYAYELIGSDTIGLCYFLSSSCIKGLPNSYTKYYFQKVKENTFKISNFYNPDNSEEVLTFSRLK
jgi:hypothetical protein